MSTLRCAVFGSTAVAAMLVIAGCGVPTESRWTRSDESTVAAPVEAQPSGVRYRVEEAPVSASTELTARVLPAVETVVTAPATGRVVRLTSTGSAVAVDEAIAEIVPGADELDGLRADIFELQIELAELEGRIDDAEAARRALAELRDRPDDDTVIVTSPVAGVLGGFLAGRSVVVQPGDPILTVGDPSSLRVDVEIGDERLDDLTVGTRLRVIDAQNRFADPAPAIVTAVEPIEAERVGTEASRWRVTAVIEPGAVLVVGDRVLVDVEVSSAAASRRVPIDAVLDDGSGKFLMVVEDDGSWRRVDVDVGLASSDFVELRTDVAVGTVVVVP